MWLASRMAALSHDTLPPLSSYRQDDGLAVRTLCCLWLQVPEDDGDMPHQLRLTYTSKIWSPYTNTIYRKVSNPVLSTAFMTTKQGLSLHQGQRIRSRL